MTYRKFFSFILCMISVLGLAGIIWSRADRLRLTDLRITTDELAAIKVERKETDLRLIKQIEFNEFPLFPDEAQSSFYYSLIENDAQAYDPPVRFKGNSSAVRLALIDGEISSETITNNIPLHIIAFNDEVYREYTVFCTTLPLLSLESEIEHIHGTQKDRDLQMTLFDNRADARQRMINMAGLVHVRGNVSTTYFPKQAYKMTLYEPTPGQKTKEADRSLLGMREDGEWILYAGYNDQERIRNVFSSELWFNSCAGANEFSIRNGNEYRFVELFMNGKYWGLYALGTPLDSKQMLPLKNTDQVQNIFVFKKSFWTEAYSDLSKDLLMRDFEIKGRDTRDNEETARFLLAEYDSTLREEKSFEESPVRPDMQNAIDTWLFVDLVQGMDTVMANGDFVNMYITLVRTQSDTVAIYTPWDLDLTWGNERQPKTKNNTVPYSIVPENNSYVMLRNPANQLAEGNLEPIIERYRELRNSTWSDEAIQQMLAGYEARIFDSGAYLRDIERWPNSTQEDSALKLSVFTDYVSARLAAMDEFIEKELSGD